MTENIPLNGRAFLPDFVLKFIGFICFIKGLLMAQHIDQGPHFVSTWLETWMGPSLRLGINHYYFSFSILSMSFAGCVSDIF